MRRFIRAFRDLAYLPEKDRRIHVFLTALEKIDEARSVVCPSLPGLLGVEIGASVDILARYSFKQLDWEEDGTPGKTVRHLSMKEFINDDGIKHLAKARVPKGARFPTAFRSPTVNKILGQWVNRSEFEELPKRRRKRRKRKEVA